MMRLISVLTTDCIMLAYHRLQAQDSSTDSSSVVEMKGQSAQSLKCEE